MKFYSIEQLRSKQALLKKIRAEAEKLFAFGSQCHKLGKNRAVENIEEFVSL